MKFKILSVVGARPNFMKIAPLLQELRKYPEMFQPRLIHTGQHYDAEMYDVFFQELELPQPDRSLGVGSGSHAEQTARVMIAFEHVCVEERPDLVVVVGDVNSTMACALTAKKLGISIAHVEAGLRSFDRSMPEEINRILTDTISDLLFLTEASAEANLLREGIAKEKMHFVGNTMVDTLFKHRHKAQESHLLAQLGLQTIATRGAAGEDKTVIPPYALVTLHRPSNVDNKETFQEILDALLVIAREMPIFFPVHPRTMHRIKEYHFDSCFTPATSLAHVGTQPTPIRLLEPLGYLDFLCLMAHAKLVLTDSGGLQEETTALGIPCVTLRHNTERPITITHESIPL